MMPSFRPLCRFLILLLLLLVAGGAPAATVEGLYETRVGVEGQGAEERERALRAGLRQVLVRVSGSTGSGELSGIAEAVAEPGRYLQQYRYVEEDEGEDLTLWMRFQSQAVRQLLEAEDLPVWGRMRPATLVWLAVEEGGERRLLGPDSDHPVHRAMVEHARLRGIPLRWPLHDLRDRRAVEPSDVAAGFVEPVRDASARYATDAVLMGRVRQDANGAWEADWTLLRGEQTSRWSVKGDLPVEVTDAGIDGTAEALAASFAGGGGEGSRVTLAITGARDLESYVDLREYLTDLSAVRRVEVRSVGGDELRLEVTLRGDADGLIQAIGLGDTLVRTRRPTDAGDVLHYRHLP
ncbi:DUF2066 domain-containing protein [Thiohalospira sp.]|uniref:DUF2066 domain-containing protein n=1 Tax=Thiohalospira sp. TaxID=3080549 RepID=UPI003981831F